MRLRQLQPLARSEKSQSKEPHAYRGTHVERGQQRGREEISVHGAEIGLLPSLCMVVHKLPQPARTRDTTQLPRQSQGLPTAISDPCGHCAACHGVPGIILELVHVVHGEYRDLCGQLPPREWHVRVRRRHTPYDHASSRRGWCGTSCDSAPQLLRKPVAVMEWQLAGASRRPASERAPAEVRPV
eukprot:scaffold3032_cov375-Prasinococcus_capsulatus_cf.AAC.7